MKQYLDLIDKTYQEGHWINPTKGKAICINGEQLKFDLREGFPILSMRKIYYEGVFAELSTMLAGKIENVAAFKEKGCNFWDTFADDVEGNIKLGYGTFWREAHGHDQLNALITGLREHPASRKHIIVGWDPSAQDQLSQHCCHYAYQWNVIDRHYLDMIWIQRSVDLMLGFPSDIVFAAAFNIVIAAATGYMPRHITMQLGNCHIYEAHIPNYLKLRQRPIHPLPHWKLSTKPDLNNWDPTELVLKGYRHEDPMNFELFK